MDALTPESSDSNQEAVANLPAEVQEFLSSAPSDADYLSFDEDGNMLLPSKVRIDLDNGHDYGRCTLATNPKLSYDETIEVYDEDGELVRTGEWVFEVQVLSANQRRINTGEVKVMIDSETMTRVEKPVFKNETRVMVVATAATPVPGSRKLPFPIEEIKRELAVRKSSDRRTGKIKPESKGKTIKAGDGDILTDSHFGSLDSGEMFRWGNPTAEIVVPETPQRAAIMAAFAEAFADSAPSEGDLEAFKVEHDLD
jgi:hypothetical protein